MVLKFQKHVGLGAAVLQSQQLSSCFVPQKSISM